MKSWNETFDIVVGALNSALIHRVLLWGIPGTGKSTIAKNAFTNRESVTLYRDCEVDSLIGPMQLRDGSTVCMPQLASKAMADGLPLVIDEIDQFSTSVETMLLAILDDKHIAELTMPDGQSIKPATGYNVIATTNERPDSLPVRLLDRFDVVLHADSPDSRAFQACGEYAKYAEQFAQRDDRSYFSEPSLRRWLAMSRIETLGSKLSIEERVRLIFGNDQSRVDSMVTTLTV